MPIKTGKSLTERIVLLYIQGMITYDEFRYEILKANRKEVK